MTDGQEIVEQWFNSKSWHPFYWQRNVWKHCRQKKRKHLQMSPGLFFDVFMEYEPGHLLIQQAYNARLSTQFDEARLRRALQRIQEQTVIIKEIDRFSPFAFPIYVDRLRERLSSEK